MDFENVAKRDFIQYVLGFYGIEGIYSLRATPEQVILATAKLLSQEGYDFAGDSIDRERVRDILISDYNLGYFGK